MKQDWDGKQQLLCAGSPWLPSRRTVSAACSVSWLSGLGGLFLFLTSSGDLIDCFLREGTFTAFGLLHILHQIQSLSFRGTNSIHRAQTRFVSAGSGTVNAVTQRFPFPVCRWAVSGAMAPLPFFCNAQPVVPAVDYLPPPSVLFSQPPPSPPSWGSPRFWTLRWPFRTTNCRAVPSVLEVVSCLVGWGLRQEGKKPRSCQCTKSPERWPG